MYRIYKILRKISTVKNIVILVSILCFFILLYVIILIPWLNAYSYDGQLLDFKIAYSHHEAFDQIQDYTPDGRMVYSYIYLVEMIFPIVYSMCLSTIITFLLLKIFPEKHKFQYLSLLPFFGALMDYFENMGIAKMISTFSEFSMTLSHTTSLCTMLKFGFIGITGVILLVFLLILLHRALARYLKKNLRVRKILYMVCLVTIVLIAVSGITLIIWKNRIELKCRIAVLLSPKSSRAHYNLGVLYYYQHRFKKAEREFMIAKYCHPSIFDGWSFYEQISEFHSSVLLEQKKYREAEEAYMNTIRMISYNHGWAYYSLHKVQWELGEYDKAKESYQKAIELYPGFDEYYHNTAMSLSPEKAEEMYRIAIRLNPSNFNAHKWLGYVLRRQKKYNEADEEYKEALRLNPNDTQIYLWRGAMYTELQKKRMAEQMWRKAIEIDRRCADAHYHLGDLLLYRKMYTGAEKEMREVIQLKPNNGQAHLKLGIALRYKNEYEEAEKELLKAIELTPRCRDGYYHLACCLAIKGEREAAFKNLELARTQGFKLWPLIDEDKALDSLRDYPPFDTLYRKVKYWEHDRKKKSN